MTAQVMDLCEHRGEMWYICEASESSAWPHPEALGFATQAPHTANWRGFVCHYRIADDSTLQLLRMIAYPAEGYETFTPAGAQRLGRTVDGLLEVKFLFADFALSFTGTLYLGRDFDESRFEHVGTQGAYRTRATLRFEQGRLVDEQVDQDDLPPPTSRIAPDTI